MTTKRKAAPKRAASANKTRPTAVDPARFIDAVKSEARRRNAQELAAMMRDIIGEPPKMWSPTILGFGTYRHVYDSGREGDICRAAQAHRVLRRDAS